ncbi:MAG: SGNH/GDSL hydrolase family protein [Bacteroidota bacterium]
MHKVVFSSVCLSLVFLSCNPELDVPVPDAGDADLTKFIAVGDNYLAGYQNGALYKKGQEKSLPALLARQFALLGCGPFNQPLMPDEKGLGLNLKPWESVFVQKSRLGDRVDCEGVSSLGPLKDSISVSSAGIYLQGVAGNSFQNLSVPFARTSQLFDAAFSLSYAQGNPNPYYYRFAGNSGSSKIYTDATAQNASFFILWIGMEDIYSYARNGGYAQTLLPSVQFSAYLDTLLGGLTAQGASGVIANIPDIATLPFFTTIPWNGLDLTQNKADSLNNLTGNLFNFAEGKNGFVIEYPSGSGNYRKMKEGEFITLTVPLDSIKCDFLGVFTPLPDRYVLDSAEVAVTRSMIAAYNSVIAQKAAQYGLALADAASFFRTVQSGIKWDGTDFNSTFVSGGFYSLDGYHPNQKGYALIANEFIKAINQRYNATIPPINCFDCDGIIFP